MRINDPHRGKFAVASQQLLKWMYRQGILGIVGYNEKFKGNTLYAEVDKEEDIHRMPKRFSSLTVETKLKTDARHM